MRSARVPRQHAVGDGCGGGRSRGSQSARRRSGRSSPPTSPEGRGSGRLFKDAVKALGRRPSPALRRRQISDFAPISSRSRKRRRGRVGCTRWSRGHQLHSRPSSSGSSYRHRGRRELAQTDTVKALGDRRRGESTASSTTARRSAPPPEQAFTKAWTAIKCRDQFRRRNHRWHAGDLPGCGGGESVKPDDVAKALSRSGSIPSSAS